MQFRSLLVTLIAASALFLFGCGNTAPVLNFENTPVVTISGKQAKLDEVKKAILLAGTAKGWQMQPVANGHIVGTLFLSGLMAKVDIKYTAETYSVTYKDSSNMRYDGENIHKRYNHWIRLLNDQIRMQLSRL